MNVNNSWMSDSNSPGFIYYELDTTPSEVKPEVESSDFLAFSHDNPSPQASRFNPTSYSSPQNFRRGNTRNYMKRGWKQSYNKSYSPNTSFHSNANNSWNRSRDSSYYSFKSRSDNSNKSKYFHPSFLEDPWANLEKQLEQKRRSESNKVEECNASFDCNAIQKNEHVT